jgi:serine/threonine-protein kinase
VAALALGVSVALLSKARTVDVAPPAVSASRIPSRAPDVARSPVTQASSPPTTAASGSAAPITTVSSEPHATPPPHAPAPEAPATSRPAGASASRRAADRPAGTPLLVATPTPTPAPPVAAARPPAEAQAYLVVVVVPWADVTLDGAPVKAVPLRRLPLAPGEHVVRFVHPDYQPLQRVVTARPGETVTLSVDLPEEGVRIGK